VDIADYFRTLAEMQLDGSACVCCGDASCFPDMRFPNARPPGKPRACRACVLEQNAEFEMGITASECRVSEGG
jgi:hypothetical protein